MTAPALEAVTELAARQVLAAAATLLEDTYPADRLTSVTLTGALRQAALKLLPDAAMSDVYQLAYDANTALAGHLHATGGDERMLTSWSRPYPRVEVCEILRAAAGVVA